MSGAGSNNALTTLEKGNDNAYGINAVENKTSSPLNCPELDRRNKKYAALKIQAYFYNTEMDIWVKGAETSASTKELFHSTTLTLSLPWHTSLTRLNGVDLEEPCQGQWCESCPMRWCSTIEVGLLAANAKQPSAAADNAVNKRAW